MTLLSCRIGRCLLALVALTIFSIPCGATESMSRTLVDGAAIPGSNGVRIGPDGLLYVTSAVGSRIDVLDPVNGALVRSLGPQQGVFGADDLAFSPAGQLYWTAFFTGEVMRLNDSGQGELVARVGPGVNAISFNDSGRLFVSRVFLADELYEIYPDGGQSPRLIRQGMGGLNAMDFGTDGALYGPLWFKGQVARVDVESGELSVVASGLDTPAAVKFSPQGALHVIDQHQGTLLRLDIASGEKTLIAMPGVGADNFDFDARGGIYISNAHEGSVSKALPNGKMLALSPGGLSMPAGITSSGNGTLVVAASQSLRSYDAQTGAQLTVQHASIGDPTTVATPLTVSAYGEQLLVSSWFSNTVQVWDPQSRTIRVTYRDFAVPLNAVASGDDVVVAELATHRVVRRHVGSMDKEILMAGIPVPSGMAVADGSLYVADWLSGNIYQLMAGGFVLATPHVVVGGLQRPEGMALDAQGRLLVVEVGSRRLLRIDPQYPQVEVLAEGLAVGLQAVPGYPPSWLLSSVAADSCGRITVTQDLNNSLLRVVPADAIPGMCRE